jgi:hypothetical protein
MAGTQVASIGVGKLSSTAKYVDKFIVEIYSDSGYTTKIGQQTSTAQWNGSAWTQKDAIVFGGLVFGTTYYLRSAVIAPISGVLSAWTNYNTAAGSASAPGCTYSGTYTATTSGIGYIITPASVPSDIDHFEAVWQFDSTVPASSTICHWSGQLTNSVITFFVGGSPGQVAKVYVRAVNTSQQAQGWQLVDTRTISTTWSGTTTGTIGDGTLLGTGGPGVYSGSTGRLGIGGTQTSSGLSTVGLADFRTVSGDHSWVMQNTTPTSGRQYGVQNLAATGFVNSDFTAGLVRTYLNSSGAYSVNGVTVADNIFTAIGSTSGAPGRMGVSGTDTFVRQTATTAGRTYGLYNTSGNFSQYDETAGLLRTTVNSSGQLGISGSPSAQLQVFGGTASLNSTTADMYLVDTTPTTGRTYATLNESGAGSYRVWDSTGSAVRTTVSSSGGYGIGATPGSDFYFTNSARSYFQNAGPGVALNDTQASGRLYMALSGSGLAQGYTIYDGTRATYPVMMDNAGQFGHNGTPSLPLDVFGQYSRTAGSGAGWKAQDTNSSGIGAYFLSGNAAAGNISINRDGSGNVTQWNSTGTGFYGTPAHTVDMFGNPYVQAAPYDFRAANTQASGRIFGVGSAAVWDGTGLYQMAIDHTAGSQRLRMDSGGQVGFNRVPGAAFDNTGAIVSSGSGAGLNTLDRTSGLTHLLYADAGYARIWNSTGGDIVTIDRSTGKLGLGATYSGDWISVQGVSVLDTNKVVAGGVRGYRYTNAGSATWLKLGTWTFNNGGSGRSVHVDIISANGYNSGSAQQAHIELIARSGNASVAPNISGGSYYGRGGSTPITGFKIVAVGGSTAVNNGAWELWVNAAAFADMIVSPTVDSGDTFTWVGTTGADPGAASSSIVVGTGGMVMNTGGTGTDAIIDSTGSPLTGGKRGFIGLTSSSNLVSGQKVGGDSGSAVNGSGGFAGFGMTPTSYIAFSGDIIIQASSTVKVRVNNTAGHQWSIASV